MLELISQLTNGLGISDEQAKGGLGSVLNFAKEKLAGPEFQQLTGALGDGTDDAMALAQTKSSEAHGGGGGFAGAFGALTGGGGLGGALGGLGGALGGAFGGAGGLGDITKMAALVKGFEAFKMDSSTLTKFLPIVIGFLKQKGGDGLAGLVSKLI